MLRQADWRPEIGLVIDGVRHREILDRLRTLVRPCELRLVFIEVDEHTRAERRPGRGETLEVLSALDAHSTERQVLGPLPEIADLLVDGTRDIEVLADEIVRWVGSQAD